MLVIVTISQLDRNDCYSGYLKQAGFKTNRTVKHNLFAIIEHERQLYYIKKYYGIITLITSSSLKSGSASKAAKLRSMSGLQPPIDKDINIYGLKNGRLVTLIKIILTEQIQLEWHPSI